MTSEYTEKTTKIVSKKRNSLLFKSFCLAIDKKVTILKIMKAGPLKYKSEILKERL